MRVLYLQNPSPFTQSFRESCFALSPKVYPHKDYELFLDLESTENYFGGEDKVLDQLETLFAAHDITPHVTVVDRIEWARSLCFEPFNVFEKGKSFEALLQRPIESLLHCGDPTQIEEESLERQKLVHFMRRVGMKTVSDFTKLPTTAVSRRFGKLGVLLQQWAMGVRTVHLPVLTPSDVLEESLDTDHVHSKESLLKEVQTTLQRLETRLKAREIAVKELKFYFYLESGQEIIRHVGLSQPMQESFSILRYLKLFFDSIEWNSPLLRLTLTVSKQVNWSPGQLSLIDQSENQFHDLSHYVQKLQERFGQTAVGVAEVQESFIPERSWKNVWPPSSSTPETPSFPERPLFLFNTPKTCVPSKNWVLTPSENIAAEWWKSDSGLRRYFKALTPEGLKLWIFWNGKNWFTHGSFE